jgi:hypothetical protein
MELIIGLIALCVIGYVLFFRKKEDTTQLEVEVKAEAPITTKTTIIDIPPAAVVVTEEVKVAESAPYKVPEPAATTPIPLVAEVPAKKPRKPRAPKTETPKKTVVKKAAPKKTASIKTGPKKSK